MWQLWFQAGKPKKAIRLWRLKKTHRSIISYWIEPRLTVAPSIGHVPLHGNRILDDVVVAGLKHRWLMYINVYICFMADPTVSTSRTQQRKIRRRAASIWLNACIFGTFRNTCIWRIAVASTVDWHRHSSKRLACHIRSQATTNPNPNVITYGVAITACEKSSQWQWALQLSPWHQLNSVNPHRQQD